jgi:hypothetical protein
MTGMLSMTMTTEMEYQFLDAEASAALAAEKAFGGAIRVKTPWEINPVLRILEYEHGVVPGVDVSKLAAAMARSLIAQISDLGLDLREPFIGAVAAGGMSIECNVGERELTFIVSNDGDIEYLKAGVGEPFEEGAFSLWSPGRLRELVSWVIGRHTQMDAAA